jgi:hypothetical protein
MNTVTRPACGRDFFATEVIMRSRRDWGKYLATCADAWIDPVAVALGISRVLSPWHQSCTRAYPDARVAMKSTRLMAWIAGLLVLLASGQRTYEWVVGGSKLRADYATVALALAVVAVFSVWWIVRGSLVGTAVALAALALPCGQWNSGFVDPTTLLRWRGGWDASDFVMVALIFLVVYTPWLGHLRGPRMRQRPFPPVDDDERAGSSRWF